MPSRTRKKMYGIVSKSAEYGFIGFIDQSTVGMGWSINGIYLWEKPPVHYCKGNEGDGRFIVRIHSKNCPIQVNMKKEWSKRPRNHSFTIKK